MLLNPQIFLTLAMIFTMNSVAVSQNVTKPEGGIGRFDSNPAPIEPSNPGNPPDFDEPIPPGVVDVPPPSKPKTKLTKVVTHNGKKWVLYQGSMPKNAILFDKYESKKIYECLSSYKGKYYIGKAYRGKPCHFRVNNKNYKSKIYYLKVN